MRIFLGCTGLSKAVQSSERCEFVRQVMVEQGAIEQGDGSWATKVETLGVSN